MTNLQRKWHFTENLCKVQLWSVSDTLWELKLQWSPSSSFGAQNTPGSKALGGRVSSRFCGSHSVTQRPQIWPISRIPFPLFREGFPALCWCRNQRGSLRRRVPGCWPKPLVGLMLICLHRQQWRQSQVPNIVSTKAEQQRDIDKCCSRPESPQSRAD